jgi:hypothetical protein
MAKKPRKKPLILRVREVAHSSDSEGKMKTVRGDEVKEAGPRRDQLPPELEARADALLDRVGKFFGHTKHTWRDGFCHDLHPDHEINAWEHIARVADLLWIEQPKALARLSHERIIKLVVAVSSNVVDIPSQMEDVNDAQVDLVQRILSGKLRDDGQLG